MALMLKVNNLEFSTLQLQELSFCMAFTVRFYQVYILTYLLTYLLTYSMEQGPSWEAS